MQPRDLSAHAEYRAGRGADEVARDLGLDPDELVVLSSNENPLGPSPRAMAAVRSSAPEIATYPKAAHVDLTEAVAAQWAVDPEQVWLGNGGDGALDYLARAVLVPGDTVLVPDPGFAYYAMSARYHHGEVRTYSVEKSRGFALNVETVMSDYDGERIVYLTSPHNPTGSRFTVDDVATIAAETDDRTLIVVDEAYAEFAEGESAVSLVQRDDVAVIRTFSKAYGLAGLRIGYALVPAVWASAYARVTTPFAVNVLACRAGMAALDDQEHVRKTVETARWSRNYLREKLDYPTWESHANFVLVEVGDASTVASTLENRGVLVRDCTSFGLPECIRITCGTESGTQRVVKELNSIR